MEILKKIKNLPIRRERDEEKDMRKTLGGLSNEALLEYEKGLKSAVAELKAQSDSLLGQEKLLLEQNEKLMEQEKLILGQEESLEKIESLLEGYSKKMDLEAMQVELLASKIESILSNFPKLEGNIVRKGKEDLSEAVQSILGRVEKLEEAARRRDNNLRIFIVLFIALQTLASMVLAYFMK